MAVNTAKRREKTQHAERMIKGTEVTLNPESYQRDLIKALNYYNINNDDKDKKKWLITHVAKTDKKLAVALLKLDDYHFRYAGILARLMDLGSVLQPTETNYFNVRIEFLKDLLNEKQKPQTKILDVVKKAIVSVQDRMEEKAHELAGEIEGAIDDFTINKKSDFSTKNYLLSNSVSAPVAKIIGDLYIGLSKELREAIDGEDQLDEGYSNFTKRELKKFLEFVDGIISDCQQQVQTAKANRSPRMRKPAPASKQVARVKYMKEFTELGLKSVNPTNIIGSSELWVYNTKNRKVTVYKAESGTLAVKGTTIIGFDIKESKTLMLRKPEEFFKGLSLGKRALGNAVKTIKTKASVPNGRLGEDYILLGAF